MSQYQILFSKQAKKDIDQLTPKLKTKLKTILLTIIADNPYEGKRLLGDLAGYYSYRLTYQDRIVYSIDEENKIVYVKRTRTHYGD